MIHFADHYLIIILGMILNWLALAICRYRLYSKQQAFKFKAG